MMRVMSWMSDCLVRTEEVLASCGCTDPSEECGGHCGGWREREAGKQVSRLMRQVGVGWGE